MSDVLIEEHELPGIEAALAATMVLMTGYSQSLQAELEPGLRLRMGASIERHLALLMHHPMLSNGFRQVLLGLCARWTAIGQCTREAVGAVGSAASTGEHAGDDGAHAVGGRLH